MNDAELSKIDQRTDGEVEVIDVKLNNRKTRKVGGKKDEKLNDVKKDKALPNEISNQIVLSQKDKNKDISKLLHV